MACPRMKCSEVTSSPTAIMLGSMLDRHPEYSQRELAILIGFDPNSASTILTQIKAGRTKLPYKYIPKLCELLNEDPAPLFTSALQEYDPEVLELLKQTNMMIRDAQELALLQSFREEKESGTEE